MHSRIARRRYTAKGMSTAPRNPGRILTTHAGRLDGPPELHALIWAARTNPVDMEKAESLVPGAMIDLVRREKATGVDIVSDGELGKLGFGLGYYGKRLAGLSSRAIAPGEPGWMSLNTGERIEFAEFYKQLSWPAPSERVICSGPLSYVGHAEVARDIERFTTALAASGLKPADAFMCVLAPGWLEHFFYNEHYQGDEEYLFALAEAIGHEYRAIVDAGFTLQVDDPALPDTYDMLVPAPPIEDYRRFARLRVDAVNHALMGIPADRVRYHICWGSWHGPHTHDLPLEHLVDLMLLVNAGAYSVEGANPRHEHEWKIWKTTKLPEDKILIPGVVSHATNVVEHPEVVADRLIRYAGVVGRDRVIAGTDCGLGLRVHPQIAWAKLKALVDGAALATAELWR
jgi:5-methyltetrahydropteroyltriglutamate--homocysteine methyltransferase